MLAAYGDEAVVDHAGRSAGVLQGQLGVVGNSDGVNRALGRHGLAVPGGPGIAVDAVARQVDGDLARSDAHALQRIGDQLDGRAGGRCLQGAGQAVVVGGADLGNGLGHAPGTHGRDAGSISRLLPRIAAGQGQRRRVGAGIARLDAAQHLGSCAGVPDVLLTGQQAHVESAYHSQSAGCLGVVVGVVVHNALGVGIGRNELAASDGRLVLVPDQGHGVLGLGCGSLGRVEVSGGNCQVATHIVVDVVLAAGEGAADHVQFVDDVLIGGICEVLDDAAAHACVRQGRVRQAHRAIVDDGVARGIVVGDGDLRVTDGHAIDTCYAACDSAAAVHDRRLAGSGVRHGALQLGINIGDAKVVVRRAHDGQGVALAHGNGVAVALVGQGLLVQVQGDVLEQGDVGRDGLGIDDHGIHQGILGVDRLAGDADLSDHRSGGGLHGIGRRRVVIDVGDGVGDRSEVQLGVGRQAGSASIGDNQRHGRALGNGVPIGLARRSAFHHHGGPTGPAVGGVHGLGEVGHHSGLHFLVGVVLHVVQAGDLDVRVGRSCRRRGHCAGQLARLDVGTGRTRGLSIHAIRGADQLAAQDVGRAAIVNHGLSVPQRAALDLQGIGGHGDTGGSAVEVDGALLGSAGVDDGQALVGICSVINYKVVSSAGGQLKAVQIQRPVAGGYQLLGHRRLLQQLELDGLTLRVSSVLRRSGSAIRTVKLGIEVSNGRLVALALVRSRRHAGYDVAQVGEGGDVSVKSLAEVLDFDVGVHHAALRGHLHIVASEGGDGRAVRGIYPLHDHHVVLRGGGADGQRQLELVAGLHQLPRLGQIGVDHCIRTGCGMRHKLHIKPVCIASGSRRKGVCGSATQSCSIDQSEGHTSSRCGFVHALHQAIQLGGDDGVHIVAGHLNPVVAILEEQPVGGGGLAGHEVVHGVDDAGGFVVAGELAVRIVQHGIAGGIGDLRQVAGQHEAAGRFLPPIAVGGRVVVGSGGHQGGNDLGAGVVLVELDGHAGGKRRIAIIKHGQRHARLHIQHRIVGLAVHVDDVAGFAGRILQHGLAAGDGQLAVVQHHDVARGGRLDLRVAADLVFGAGAVQHDGVGGGSGMGQFSAVLDDQLAGVVGSHGDHHGILTVGIDAAVQGHGALGAGDLAVELAVHGLVGVAIHDGQGRRGLVDRQLNIDLSHGGAVAQQLVVQVDGHILRGDVRKGTNRLGSGDVLQQLDGRAGGALVGSGQRVREGVVLRSRRADGHGGHGLGVGVDRDQVDDLGRGSLSSINGLIAVRTEVVSRTVRRQVGPVHKRGARLDGVGIQRIGLFAALDVLGGDSVAIVGIIVHANQLHAILNGQVVIAGGVGELDVAVVHIDGQSLHVLGRSLDHRGFQRAVAALVGGLDGRKGVRAEGVGITGSERRADLRRIDREVHVDVRAARVGGAGGVGGAGDAFGGILQAVPGFDAISAVHIHADGPLVALVLRAGGSHEVPNQAVGVAGLGQRRVVEGQGVRMIRALLHHDVGGVGRLGVELPVSGAVVLVIGIDGHVGGRKVIRGIVRGFAPLDEHLAGHGGSRNLLDRAASEDLLGGPHGGAALGLQEGDSVLATQHVVAVVVLVVLPGGALVAGDVAGHGVRAAADAGAHLGGVDIGQGIHANHVGVGGRDQLGAVNVGFTEVHHDGVGGAQRQVVISIR